MKFKPNVKSKTAPHYLQKDAVCQAVWMGVGQWSCFLSLQTRERIMGTNTKNGTVYSSLHSGSSSCNFITTFLVFFVKKTAPPRLFSATILEAMHSQSGGPHAAPALLLRFLHEPASNASQGGSSSRTNPNLNSRDSCPTSTKPHWRDNLVTPPL